MYSTVIRSDRSSNQQNSGEGRGEVQLEGAGSGSTHHQSAAACRDALRHTQPQEAAARRVMAAFQSFLTRGALNADRDLRRHDGLAPPPPPRTGGEHPSGQSALTASDRTTKQQRFSPSETAAVKETLFMKMKRRITDPTAKAAASHTIVSSSTTASWRETPHSCCSREQEVMRIFQLLSWMSGSLGPWWR